MDRLDWHGARVQKHCEIPATDISEFGAEVFTEALLFLRTHCINYIAASGTALGLYREGSLIPTDTDIDISIMAYPGIEDLLKRSFSHYRLGIEAHLSADIQQLAFLPKGIILDFHMYYPEKEQHVCVHSGGRIAYPKKHFDKSIVIDTDYGDVRFPYDIEGYLTYKYGADWRIPTYRKKGTYAR